MCKSLISNYIPISVLPYFSKILEKLMVTRLSTCTYLDRFALLSPAQVGFQCGKSTYMALLEMQTCISEAMNSSRPTKTSFHQLHLLTLENTNSYQIFTI